MTGRSHLLIAGASYLALALHPLATPLGVLEAPRLQSAWLTPGMASLAVATFAVAVAGLLPDLDKAGSTAARAGGLFTRVLAAFVEHTLHHRGPLHSALAAIAAWALGSWVGQLVGLAGLGDVFAYGWAAHLLLDAWTRRGIPIFWPVRATLRLPPGFSTGGLLEPIVLLVSLVACGYWALTGVIQIVGAVPPS